MKKRKQHYVWEYYLKGWAPEGKVWCQRAGKRFHVSTDNIAHARDFYRLKEMSAYDFDIVGQLISRMAEPLREIARGWIPHFAIVHELKRAYETSGKKNLEVEEQIDITINNMEEDIHASVESDAVPILDALRDGDGSVLDDDHMFLNFARFIAMQYMRTPGIQRSVSELQDIPGFNVEAAMGLLRTISATNMGQSFYSKRQTFRLTFLDAPPGLEFITGDQPIVNIRAVGLPDGVPPTELELFYPVSPERAVLMEFDHTTAVVKRRAITGDEMFAYNQIIVAASDEQIYARSENALALACGE